MLRKSKPRNRNILLLKKYIKKLLKHGKSSKTNRQNSANGSW